MRDEPDKPEEEKVFIPAGGTVLRASGCQRKQECKRL